MQTADGAFDISRVTWEHGKFKPDETGTLWNPTRVKRVPHASEERERRDA
jgi:hypothetical protein